MDLLHARGLQKAFSAEALAKLKFRKSSIVIKSKILGNDIAFSGLPWHLQSDWSGLGIKVMNGDQTAMELSWEIGSGIGTNYELAIADPRQDLLCLCMKATQMRLFGKFYWN